ncbi:MAG: threonyl-tRNA synthetase editing domain-containing protein [Deltaproteobacteria bacterium]
MNHAMKLLLFYAYSFSFSTAEPGLPGLPPLARTDRIEKTAVVFFHVEAEDREKRAKVIQKFVKNTKWLAGKFETKNVVLHSFNHLSGSKAPPEFSREVLAAVRERLTRTGFTVLATPFGYFNEFSIHVAGDSLAKVFKEF